MRSVIIWISLVFINVIFITYSGAEEHEHKKNLYAALCDKKSHMLKDMPGIEMLRAGQPDDGFHVLMGCKLLRRYYVRVFKPDMDFKTEEDYNEMCHRISVKKDSTLAEGIMSAFHVNATWICENGQVKGTFQCSVKGEKLTLEKTFYMTFRNKDLKFFVGLTCVAKEKLVGWQVFSMAKSLTEAENKEVEAHITSLGFDVNGKGLQFNENC